MKNTEKQDESSKGTWNDRWLGLKTVSPEIADMVDHIERWAKSAISNRIDDPRMLVLVGKNGVGKTMALKGCERYFRAARMHSWETGHWGQSPPEVIACIWHKVAQLDPHDDADIFEDIIRPQIALIDDIGSEVDQYKSGLPTSNLAYVLGGRQNKWTLITTNILPEDWTDQWDKRVADRLHRNSMIITVRTTKSWALKHD